MVAVMVNQRDRIVRHVAGCGVCGWLSRLAIRRRESALLGAAIRLREGHAVNDAEREAFARGPIRIAIATPTASRDGESQDRPSNAAELRFSARSGRTLR